jgi:8-oxo-dGTP pyrophosphatase MutT (NUDIX family)
MVSPRFPVSVKGVVLGGAPGRPVVALLLNERDEWELPGGTLERGERPEACLVREVAEELGLRVAPGPLLDAWVHHVPEGEVLILTYGCLAPPFTAVTASPEHRAAGLFGLDQLPGLRMAEGYRSSVRAWIARQAP